MRHGGFETPDGKVRGLEAWPISASLGARSLGAPMIKISTMLGSFLDWVRRRGRGLLVKGGLTNKSSTIVLLLIEIFFLTPERTRATPRYHRKLTWLSCISTATGVMGFGLFVFYAAGGFDIRATMPSLAGIPGPTLADAMMGVAGALFLGLAILGWWGGDHGARWGSRFFAWRPVTPAPFGYYVVSACSAWTWMGLGLAGLGLAARTAGTPFWSWLAGGSSGAITTLVIGGGLLMAASFRRQALRRQFNLEVYGGDWRAVRSLALFQVLPLVSLGVLFLPPGFAAA